MPSLILKPEKWVQGGFTLAHASLPGNPATVPVFVHGALPGETIQARVVRERAGRAYAVTERVLEGDRSETRRIDSDCPIFPACGGCSYRHIPYENETDLKVDLLREMRNLAPALERLQTFTASPQGYRHVARLHRKGSTYGFYGIWSETLLPLPDNGCMHLAPQMNQAVLEASSDRRSPEPASASQEEVSFYLSHDGTIVTSDQPAPFDIQAGSLSWQYRPGLFLQANRFLLAPWLNYMSSQVDAWAGQLNPSRSVSCLELFCGTGLIGAALTSHLSSYTGIESSVAAIEQAKINFAAAAKKASTRGADLKTSLRVADLYRQPERLQLPSTDLWIVNPPRAGLKEGLCHHAGRSTAQWIVYSSCNPQTLDRDVGLLHGSGFRLADLALFDFFPRTPHLELVAILKRVGSGPT